jgi:transcriptional regulator with XRE-family HTH domain
MKLTQCELAKRLVVGQSHLWKWEAGMRKPSDANLMRLCEALGVTTDYIMRAR